MNEKNKMAIARRRRFHSARHFKVFSLNIFLSNFCPISSSKAFNCGRHWYHGTSLEKCETAPRAKRLSPSFVATVAQWAEDGFTFRQGLLYFLAILFLFIFFIPFFNPTRLAETETTHHIGLVGHLHQNAPRQRHIWSVGQAQNPELGIWAVIWRSDFI